MKSVSFFENLPIGIFTMACEPPGKITQANQEFLRIFGYKKIEQVNKSLFSRYFINEDSWDLFYRQLVAERSIGSYEVQLQTSAGSHFWASINANLVEDAKSRTGWIAATLENIDERKFEQLRIITHMEILRQASLSLTSSLDLKDVLNTIALCAKELVPGMRNCHIFLYQPDNGHPLVFGTALWGDGRKGHPFSQPRSDGLSMTVALSGKPILVADMRSDPIYADTPESWTGSIIGLPLKIADRVVGVMNVSHTEPGGLTEHNLSLLRMLADQAAIAIENARLYEAIATEERHLSLVYDIGRELEPSLNSDEILGRAARLTCEAIGSSLGVANLYDQQESKFVGIKMYASKQGELHEISIAPETGLFDDLLERVSRNHSALNIPDLRFDEHNDEVPDQIRSMRAMLGSPIIHGGQLQGVLCLFHEQSNYFTPDHQDLVRAICCQVGVAMSNIDRFEQVQQLVEMLEREQQRLLDLVERLPVGVVLLDEGYHPIVFNTYAGEILLKFGIKDPGAAILSLGEYTLDELIEQSDNNQAVEIQIDGSHPMNYELETRPLIGEKHHWILMLRDVTHERQIQSRVHMQDRLATVGQLAAGIAHDFNNIMATILVYSDLLKKDFAMKPDGLEQLTIIQQQVNRAASLIRQILDFSRQSVMEPAALDLLPFIKEFEKLLDRVMPETIRVKLKFHPGDYPVHADPTQLQQVFMNLAINARDAMPKGGILSINIDHLNLMPGEVPPSPYLPHGEWIAITVGDTGTGIPPEVIPHIFEPFYTTKPVGKGTGLGLAQAYGIIKQHGGYIDVQSEVGEGTRFAIYLPTLATQQYDKVDVLYASPVEGHGRTILVVEDDPITLNAIQDLLEAQEYRVIAANNGNEALQILEIKSGEVDLLVSDMVMPEMGGLSLYNQVQERWPDIRTMFVTGHPMGMERQELLEEKSITWLQKPFSVPEFFFKVEEILAAG